MQPRRPTFDKCLLLGSMLGNTSRTSPASSNQSSLLFFPEGMFLYSTLLLPLYESLFCLIRFGTKRVRANQVYQEFIADKHHLHMNSTRWVTLTEFVKHLGRTGVARVDETEKGWFIAWIDSSPKALAKAVRAEIIPTHPSALNDVIFSRKLP